MSTFKFSNLIKAITEPQKAPELQQLDERDTAPERRLRRKAQMIKCFAVKCPLCSQLFAAQHNPWEWAIWSAGRALAASIHHQRTLALVVIHFPLFLRIRTRPEAVRQQHTEFASVFTWVLLPRYGLPKTRHLSSAHFETVAPSDDVFFLCFPR